MEARGDAVRRRGIVTARGSLAPVVAALLAALAFAGCSGDDGDGDGGSPVAADVPEGAVAKVGDDEIGEDELDAQVAVLARAQRGGAGGGGKAAAERQREQLRSQALAYLLMREAIEQEAAERGVTVRRAEAAKRWRTAAKQQFKTRKALRRFLGGQTQADLIEQLRMQMLSERIAEQVAEEAGGGEDGRKAAARFQKEFRERWAKRTACAEGYEGPGCANAGSSDSGE